MFPLTTAFTALSFLGTLVNALPITRPTNDIAIGIAAIKAHFTNADLVPSLLPSFDPSAVMTVTFPGVGPISPGQSLSIPQVATAPVVTITPANGSVPTGGNFTLVMVDANITGTNESGGQVRHWLVNYATLQTESASLNVSTDRGVAVTEYVGPQPPSGSGSHRYVILLLPQPASFSPPANLTSPNVGLSVDFPLTNYISTSHLGQPIAGMYFDVELGTPNVTVPATSAVVSSTLVPAATAA